MRSWRKIQLLFFLAGMSLAPFQSVGLWFCSRKTAAEKLLGRWAADLIVMGTHGRIGIARLVLGSVAEGVLQIAPVPVLLVCCA